MAIIVTAATGHLGALIVESLLERGAAADTVVATARDASRLQPLADRGVRTARIDYEDPASVGAVVQPGDVLILVSGTALGDRVAQHSGVIAAAKEAGVARIVYTSAPAATTSALVLAPEHKGTEEYLTASGVPFTILRNGWYTENYANQIPLAREHGEIVASVGDGRVASASRQDYAEAAAVAALDEAYAGRVLELSGDLAWSFDELAAAIAGIIGRPVAYRSLSPEEHLEQLKAAGLDEGTAGFVVALDRNIRDGLLGVTTGDLATAIGRPTTPFAETLAAEA
jgi:NAD(P)H dehydrogenase (quinone)